MGVDKSALLTQCATLVVSWGTAGNSLHSLDHHSGSPEEFRIEPVCSDTEVSTEEIGIIMVADLATGEAEIFRDDLFHRISLLPLRSTRNTTVDVPSDRSCTSDKSRFKHFVVGREVVAVTKAGLKIFADKSH